MPRCYTRDPKKWYMATSFLSHVLLDKYLCVSSSAVKGSVRAIAFVRGDDHHLPLIRPTTRPVPGLWYRSAVGWGQRETSAIVEIPKSQVFCSRMAEVLVWRIKHDDGATTTQACHLKYGKYITCSVQRLNTVYIFIGPPQLFLHHYYRQRHHRRNHLIALYF